MFFKNAPLSSALNLSGTQSYSEPCQTSKMEDLEKVDKAENYQLFLQQTLP